MCNLYKLETKMTATLSTLISCLSQIFPCNTRDKMAEVTDLKIA